MSSALTKRGRLVKLAGTALFRLFSVTSAFMPLPITDDEVRAQQVCGFHGIFLWGISISTHDAFDDTTLYDVPNVMSAIYSLLPVYSNWLFIARCWFSDRLSLSAVT